MGSLSAIVVGNVSGIEQKKVESKSGGRHSGKGERVVNRNVTVFAKLVPLNILFLSVSARRCRED